MKITNVETLLVTGPISNDPYIRKARGQRSAAFIRVSTDSELIGWGETYAGYFFPEIVPGVVDFFTPILIDRDVDSIHRLWQDMYYCGNFWCRNGLGASVLTGIEAALWDLKGKRAGLPVYELLGGRKHDSLPCYATGGPSNYPQETLAAKLDHYLSLGFTGIKLGAGVHVEGKGWEMPRTLSETAELEAEKMDFVRTHVGKDVSVMLDGHMSNSPHRTWSLADAVAVMKAVEPYDLLFFEEPLHYNDIAGYAELCRQSRVPIAGGECLTVFSEWQPFLEKDAFDIAQPDASFMGGLEVFMKVASAFESRGRTIATHSWGAGGSLMQNIHCAFASGNTMIVEVPPEFGPLHSEIMGESYHMRDGTILPPKTPGLGITVKQDLVDKYPFVPGSGEFNSVPGKVMKG
jgi:galactonate dehydratase